MNTPGIITYTAALASLGLASQDTSLTGLVGPPVKGRITRFKVTPTGPATLLSFRMREGSAGEIRFETIDDPVATGVAFVVQPLPVDYEVTLTTDLKFEAECDDGTNSTSLAIEIEIENF